MDNSPTFIKIAKIEDFKTIPIRSYRVLGRNVGIVKDQDGMLFATEISCKHQNADLTTGKLKGDTIRCPRHGWLYNIKTGECLNHDSSPLRRYDLEIRGDDIYVSTLPVEPADEEDEMDWDAEIIIRRDKK